MCVLFICRLIFVGLPLWLWLVSIFFFFASLIAMAHGLCARRHFFNWSIIHGWAKYHIVYSISISIIAFDASDSCQFLAFYQTIFRVYTVTFTIPVHPHALLSCSWLILTADLCCRRFRIEIDNILKYQTYCGEEKTKIKQNKTATHKSNVCTISLLDVKQPPDYSGRPTIRISIDWILEQAARQTFRFVQRMKSEQFYRAEKRKKNGRQSFGHWP